MKNLIEDYKKKLEIISCLIKNLPSNCPDNPQMINYKTKASCYMTFIAELERECAK